MFFLNCFNLCNYKSHVTWELNFNEIKILSPSQLLNFLSVMSLVHTWLKSCWRVKLQLTGHKTLISAGPPGLDAKISKGVIPGRRN